MQLRTHHLLLMTHHLLRTTQQPFMGASLCARPHTGYVMLITSSSKAVPHVQDFKFTHCHQHSGSKDTAQRTGLEATEPKVTRSLEPSADGEKAESNIFPRDQTAFSLYSSS